MIDIVRFEGTRLNLGFSKVYNLKELKIIEEWNRIYNECYHADG